MTCSIFCSHYGVLFLSSAEMSELSSEDSLQIRRAPRSTAAATEDFKNLSDDSSDDGAPKDRPPSRQRSLSPRSSEPGDGSDPDRERDLERDNLRERERSSSPQLPPIPPRRIDAAFRKAGVHGACENTADMLHFPPNITLLPSVTTKLEEVPVEQNPILYRLRPGVRGNRTAAETILDLMKEHRNDPVALSKVMQSNANLITWSDGSRTIAIGSQQFLLIEDAMVSKHFVFRKGNDIQTCETLVRSVARVQPSSTSDAKDKLALATAAMRKASKREGRVMLRCMDGDGEQQEAKAKIENNRKERERARLEAKRRRSRESHVRPNRGLTVDVLESDYESEEDQVRRMAERMDAERLMRAKRAAPPRTVDVKRRKAGGRRVLGLDEDESDESD